MEIDWRADYWKIHDKREDWIQEIKKLKEEISLLHKTDSIAYAKQKGTNKILRAENEGFKVVYKFTEDEVGRACKYFGWEIDSEKANYVRTLVLANKKLLVENDRVKSSEFFSCAAVKASNRLRKELEDISKGYNCSACSCRCHVSATKALEDEG